MRFQSWNIFKIEPTSMGMKPIKVRSTIEVLFTSRSQSCTYAAVYVHDSVDYTYGGRFHPLHMRVIKDVKS